MDLEYLIVTETHPADRDDPFVWHEGLEFFAPAKIPEFSQVVDLSTLLHFEERRNRIELCYVNLVVHGVLQCSTEVALLLKRSETTNIA